MIRIADKKLIIEINCGDTYPLEILGDLQLGLAKIIEVIDFDNSTSPLSSVKYGMKQISFLLSEMNISNDQLSGINKNFAKEDITEFNKW